MPSRDFTKKREDVFFTVDEERFDCWPGLIAGDLRALGDAIGDGVTVQNVMDKLEAIFNITMQPESLTRFRERLSDRKRPIDLTQFAEIIEWIVEVYTKRPTLPSSSSSSGSANDDGGSFSTAGVSAVGSTLPASTQIDLPTLSTTT